MISQLIRTNLKTGKKLFALLIDPDKHNDKSLKHIVSEANKSNVDLLFIGGSL